MRQNPESRIQNAFTLVELLVVIGIIGVLISILVPLIAKMQIAAKETQTRNLIGKLEVAINQYAQSNHNAFPGPFSNDQIGNGSVFARSGSENMTLGLLGGIDLAGAYDAASVGRGPLNMNTADRRRMTPFIDVRPGSYELPAKPSGRFVDETGNQANDGPVPVFVDYFNNPLPILYLRARRSASGIVTNNGRAPYDINQVIPYTGTSLGGKAHGLTDVGAAGPLTPTGINQGLAYFTNPTIPGSPRQADGFILISAGADRTWGTYDDVCSFGSLHD